MTTPGKRKGGGGKLNRTENVTVRLDPRLRYLAELAARKQRRTLSSFIEWAIEDSFSRVSLGESSQGRQLSVEQAAGELWDVHGADRLLSLESHYPGLLTFKEQELLKHLREAILEELAPEGDSADKNVVALRLGGLLQKVLRVNWNRLATSLDSDSEHIQQDVMEASRQMLTEDSPPKETPSKKGDQS